MFINDFIKTNQEGTQVYLFAAPVKDILNHYTVESHNVRSNPTGYLGKMNYDSYTERANQILELGASYFVSKPIITAINRRDMADYETSLELQNDMRIVDGHIEVMGLSTVLEEHSDSDFGEILMKKTVPVMLLVVEDVHDRIRELQTFIEVNATNNDVNTLRAKSLLSGLRGEKVSDLYTAEDIREKVAHEIALHLFSVRSDTVWSDMVQRGEMFDMESMRDSLLPFVDKMLGRNVYELTGVALERVIDFAKYIVSGAWEKVQYEWGCAFVDLKRVNGDYMIHEKLGVHTVHSLLADCVCGFDAELGITKEGLTSILYGTRGAFDSMLKDSKLDSGWEWKRSELFGSLTVGDVDKVKHYIKYGAFPTE